MQGKLIAGNHRGASYDDREPRQLQLKVKSGRIQGTHRDLIPSNVTIAIENIVPIAAVILGLHIMR